MKPWNLFRVLDLSPMPESIRFSLRRRLLDRALDRERREAVKSGGSAQEVWDLGDWQLEYQLLEEDEAGYHSRQLLHRARQLRIPVPPLMDESGVSSDYKASGLDGHRYFLSLTGEQKLRAAIREEERYRSERWARRIPYITSAAFFSG